MKVQRGKSDGWKWCTGRRKRGQTGRKEKEKARMREEHTGYKGLHTSHTFFPTHMNIDFMKLEGRLGASVT